MILLKLNTIPTSIGVMENAVVISETIAATNIAAPLTIGWRVAIRKAAALDGKWPQTFFKWVQVMSRPATLCGIGSASSIAPRFRAGAGAILAVTGIAKVWSAFGSSKFLAVIDPIFGVTFGKLMLVVGVAEIAIALVCFFSKRQTLALGLVAWMSTNFVVYRLGLRWMDWHRPCSCLGNLTDALHISPQVADNIMKVILAYLLIGSYGLLIWRWRQSTVKNLMPDEKSTATLVSDAP